MEKYFLTDGLPFFISGINWHNKLKNIVMKFVKLSVLALSMGLFVASCGNGGGEAPKTDSAATAAPAPAPAPAPAAAPADTMNAGAAKPADTSKMAPAADSKMEKKDEKKK